MNGLMTKAFGAAVVAAAFGFANAGEPLTGDNAVAKFPASLQKMGLTTAKWMQLTNGVEYYYGYFTNLLGTIDGYTKSKNAVHLLRIDYANAPVVMKFVDHTQESPNKWTTSKTAARDNALFAINLMMEDQKARPQGYAKADGKVIPNGMTVLQYDSKQDKYYFTGVKGGYAFNDDKTYAFSKDWMATNSVTGRIPADDWKNVFTIEATTLSDGKVTWGSGASYFGRANYPFFGTTADGVFWVGTVDGRNSTSDGLGYHEVAALQKELGCIDGVCCDGGGSTTMAIRKDLMPVSDICPTQKLSSDADGKYYTMNFLYDGTAGVLPNGSERKVINQLLFVVPFELGDAAARPSTNYNGSVVTVPFSGDLSGDVTATAMLTLVNPNYACAGTVDAERGVVTFRLDDTVVTAGNVYEGTVTVTVGDDVYTREVTLAQGTIKIDENTDWIRESSSAFGTTGAWSADAAPAADAIAVTDAVFTASSAAPEDAVVTIASTFGFNGANDEDSLDDPANRAAVKVVEVDGVNRYAFLTGVGVVTNLDVVADLSAASCVTVTIDNVKRTLDYAIGGDKFGPFPSRDLVGGVAAVGYVGETDVASLTGSYRAETLDANLAKADGTEYATVADAIAAGNAQIELLWDTTWNPTAAGEVGVSTNGHVLAIGGDMAWSVKGNGDGTITVTVTGGEPVEGTEPASITIVGSTVKVGVKDAKAGLWYALAKTSDLSRQFVVDDTTWTEGAALLSAEKILSISLGDGEKQAFYRIVVAEKPANE